MQFIFLLRGQSQRVAAAYGPVNLRESTRINYRVRTRSINSLIIRNGRDIFLGFTNYESKSIRCEISVKYCIRNKT